LQLDKKKKTLGEYEMKERIQNEVKIIYEVFGFCKEQENRTTEYTQQGHARHLTERRAGHLKGRASWEFN
jgi:hypothetical protein